MEDETGISNVLYTIEINEMCPAIMDYVRTAKDGFWTTAHNETQLKPFSSLTIFLMVEHNNEVFKTTEKLQIDKDLNYRSVRTNNVVNLSKEYERNSCEIPPTNSRTCIPTKTVYPNATGVCEGELIFEETFDSDTALNSDLWKFDIRMLLELDEMFALFDDNDANQFIKDGILNIVPTALQNIRSGSISFGDRCTAKGKERLNACSRVATPTHNLYLPPVNSTLIHTQKSFSFKYGRVEVRAKLPKGDWILPYIMLQESSKFVDITDGNQIRIAFARGNNQLKKKSTDEEIGGSRLYGGIFYKSDPSNYEDIRNKKNSAHWGDNFHKFELIWTPEKIALAVDDETYGEINKSVDVEHFLTFGVSVGGHKEFPDDVDNKPWINVDPRAMGHFFKAKDQWKSTWSGHEGLKVDYVKIYAV